MLLSCISDIVSVECFCVCPAVWRSLIAWLIGFDTGTDGEADYDGDVFGLVSGACRRRGRGAAADAHPKRD